MLGGVFCGPRRLMGGKVRVLERSLDHRFHAVEIAHHGMPDVARRQHRVLESIEVFDDLVCDHVRMLVGPLQEQAHLLDQVGGLGVHRIDRQSRMGLSPVQILLSLFQNRLQVVRQMGRGDQAMFGHLADGKGAVLGRDGGIPQCEVRGVIGPLGERPQGIDRGGVNGRVEISGDGVADVVQHIAEASDRPRIAVWIGHGNQRIRGLLGTAHQVHRRRRRRGR